MSLIKDYTYKRVFKGDERKKSVLKKGKDMSWIKYIEYGQKSVEAIFKEREPALDNIELQEISIGPRYSDSIEITFDLFDYPINPPKKWLQQKYNTISLKFGLVTISDFNMSRWENQYDKKVKITLISKGDKIYFSIIGETISFSCTTETVHVLSLSAYRRSQEK